MDVPVTGQTAYVFGPFRLDPVRRTVTRDGVALKLAPRLFDTLLFLVQNHSRLVQRDELVRAIWQGRTVDENNLGQAISALRRALQGEGAADPAEAIILTVPGRGYRLAMPVTLDSTLTPAPPPAAPPVLPAVSRRPLWMLAAGLLGVALCVVALWRQTYAPPPALQAPPHSVAVLAFSNLSGDAGQDYFSDGLSEELIDALGRIGGLHVAARVSAFSFKGQPVGVDEIARQLHVATVLEGSVRRDGGMLRVTAQLIDAASGYQIWSHSYDAAQGGVLQVQGNIAAAVAGALKMSLVGSDVARLSLGGTANAQAFDAYLRGMKLVDSGNAGSAAALHDFDDAVAADPSFALAHVQRAVALQAQSETQSNPDPAWVVKTQDEVIAEARRAVALAPDLGVAHAALGHALEEDRFDFAGAATELTRAVQLSPGAARTQLDYAWLQLALGHFAQAIAAAQVAAQLDPLSAITYLELAGILSDSRHYDEALLAVRHAEQLQSDVSDLDRNLTGEIALRQGRFADARAACGGAHGWEQRVCLAIAENKLGHRAEAVAQMEALRGMLGDTGALQYAGIYAQWGETALAVQWLQTAYRLHDAGLIELKVYPELDPVRGTPEYRDIEARMNFPL
jgi:serine/threonine-protein kinase